MSVSAHFSFPRHLTSAPSTHSNTDVATASHQSMSIEQADNLPVNWISTNTQLTDLLTTLESCQVVALDTEFIKRDTYYPRLALIQINTGEQIYLLDAPKLQLDPLWQVLAELPVMIWHACGEDLGIFYLLSQCPALHNVFDTQMALAYLTGQLQMGYQKALHTILDVHVDKEHSQSNWLARPLSPEQEAYAINDVRYLLPLYHRLVAQLVEKNWLNQVWEDCQVYAQELYDSQQIKDEEQYLSALDFRHNRLQRLFLQELLAWREKLAKAINQPRTFILRKQAVRELVELLPTSVRQLRQNTSIHRSVIDKYGNEILRIVRRVNEQQHADCGSFPPPIVAPYRSKDKSMHKAVNHLIANYSERTGIPKNVLIKKKWRTDLYELVALDEVAQASTRLPMGLLGWRWQWIEGEMIPLLQGYRDDLRQGMGLDNSESD